MIFKNKIDAFLSIEIGGTKLQWVVYASDAEVLKRGRLKIDKDKGAQGIQNQLETGLAEILTDFNIIKTGVGFGGPVNRETGIIGESHQISGWTSFPLSEWLEGITKSPVYIENDANTAALGEAVYGAGRGYRTVFYATLGSGIGGGIVQNGQLYSGREQGESEFGHLRIDQSGTTLESVCAGWAVDKKIRETVQDYPESILAKLIQEAPGEAEARFLSAALVQDCPVAVQILDDVVSTLAWACSHVIHLFNPDILIFGGGLSLIGEPLRKGLCNKVPKYVMRAFQPIPEIKLAGLGEEVVPMGALALILSKKNN